MPRGRRTRGRAAGEGSIRRRTITRKDGSTYKRYSAVITMGWIDGKQKQREGPLRATEKEARDDLKQMLEERDESGLSNYATMTLSQYLDYWLEQRQPYLAERSHRNYRLDSEKYIKPRIGHVQMRDLSPVVIQAWQTKLLKDKTPHVAKRTRAALSAALRQAVHWQILKYNLMDAVPPVKLPEKNRRRWTLAEVRRFLKVAEPHPLYPLFLLTLNTGLRIGEVRGLRWGDIDGNVMRVRHQIQGYSATPRFLALKTKGSRRNLTLPADVLFALAQHRKRQDERRALAGTLWRDYDLVFCTGIGTPLGPDKIYDALVELIHQTVRDDLNQIIKDIAGKSSLTLRDLERTFKGVSSPKEETARSAVHALIDMAAEKHEIDAVRLHQRVENAGIRRIRFHDLRHTNASLLIRMTDAKTVSKRLGHADSSITHRIYVHEFEDQLEKFAPSMDDLLGGNDDP
jgi:integrase